MTSTHVQRGFRSSREACIDLTGTWRNQLGSTMSLQRIGDSNQFTGRYSTAVESEAGASEFSSDISGLVQPVVGGSLVAFNVLWKHGDSISTFVGQCVVHDGQEMLYTTWVLRSLKIPSERWMNTRINQDTFWRVDDECKKKADDTTVNIATSGILGEWKSITGDSVEITEISEQGSMEGLHKAASTKSGTKMYGRFDGDDTYTAFGFVTANEQSIKGWAGYVYDPQDTNQLMETCWLSHAFSNLDNDPRKHVQFGIDNYAKSNANSE